MNAKLNNLARLHDLVPGQCFKLEGHITWICIILSIYSGKRMSQTYVHCLTTEKTQVVFTVNWNVEIISVEQFDRLCL